MTNEQYAACLKLLRADLDEAIKEGQNRLAEDHPETIGLFRALNTGAFKPFKALVRKLDQQIETLKPTFP